jgi:hypothetical protein
MHLPSTLWIPALAALAACRASATAPNGAHEATQTAPPAALTAAHTEVPAAAQLTRNSAADWSDASAVTSALGTYRVLYRTHPHPLPRGEPFAIDVWVFAAAERELPLDDIGIEADAGMPTHGHGMNRVPSVTRVSPGRFRVEGMYFHMPGPWELYFDVRRGAHIERAQVAIELE